MSAKSNMLLNSIVKSLQTSPNVQQLATIVEKLNKTCQPMVPASQYTDGKGGLVPHPRKGDNTKFLRGDGTWQSMATSSLLEEIVTNTPNKTVKACLVGDDDPTATKLTVGKKFTDILITRTSADNTNYVTGLEIGSTTNAGVLKIHAGRGKTGTASIKNTYTDTDAEFSLPEVGGTFVTTGNATDIIATYGTRFDKPVTFNKEIYSKTRAFFDDGLTATDIMVSGEAPSIDFTIDKGVGLIDTKAKIKNTERCFSFGAFRSLIYGIGTAADFTYNNIEAITDRSCNVNVVSGGGIEFITNLFKLVANGKESIVTNGKIVMTETGDIYSEKINTSTNNLGTPEKRWHYVYADIVDATATQAKNDQAGRMLTGHMGSPHYSTVYCNDIKGTWPCSDGKVGLILKTDVRYPTEKSQGGLDLAVQNTNVRPIFAANTTPHDIPFDGYMWFQYS